MNPETLKCWIWRGQGNNKGYGMKSVRGRLQLTHRLSYQWVNGPIPAGMKVLHRCDTPACFNPNHLFIGTQSDNMRDMMLKGRALTVSCKRGHTRTPENTYTRIDSKGHRQRTCRVCDRERCTKRSKQHAEYMKKYHAARKQLRLAGQAEVRTPE
jgi:hypothetical protein